MNKKILFVSMVILIIRVAASYRPQLSCAKTFHVTFRLENKVANITALSLDDLKRQIVPIYSYKLECRGKAVTSFDDLCDNDCIDILPTNWRRITFHIVGRTGSLGSGVVWASSLPRLREAASKLFDSNETVESIIRSGKIFYRDTLLEPAIWDVLDDFIQVDIVEK